MTTNIYYEGRIYEDCKFIETPIGRLPDFNNGIKLIGEHSFNNGQDVTGMYEKRFQTKFGTQWSDSPEIVYIACIESGRRIIAVPIEKDAFDKFSDSCTQEEVDSKSYLEWSDERLGQAVRALADRLKKTDVNGFKGVMTMAASYALLDLAIGANSFTTKLSFDGYTNKRHPEYGEMSATITIKLKSSKQ